MEHPVEEISDIIHILTQATPSSQKQAVLKYFTPDAAFTHPFCATGSWRINLFGVELDSRWVTIQIYQWYKIMSPQIDLEVLSVTFNEDNLRLYVDIHQHFRLFLVPYYDASVWFTTVLQLAEGDESGPSSALQTSPSSHRQRFTLEKPYSYAALTSPDQLSNGSSTRKYYYITSQNDLYQTSEFIKFLVPWGIGSTLMIALQLFATFLSILGATVLFPLTWYKQSSIFDPPKKI